MKKVVVGGGVLMLLCLPVSWLGYWQAGEMSQAPLIGNDEGEE